MKYFWVLFFLCFSFAARAERIDYSRYNIHNISACNIENASYEFWFGIFFVGQQEYYLASFCEEGDEWCEEPLLAVVMEEVDEELNEDKDYQMFRAIRGQGFDRVELKITLYVEEDAETGTADISMFNTKDYGAFKGFPKRFKGCFAGSPY